MSGNHSDDEGKDSIEQRKSQKPKMEMVYTASRDPTKLDTATEEKCGKVGTE